MADWLQKLSDKFGSGFIKKKPLLIELLPQLIDPEDPRVELRPMGGDWLCPYSGQRLMLPEWDGLGETLLDQPAVINHLLGLAVLQQKGLEAQMLSWEYLLRVLTEVRVRESENYRVSSDKGYWICPHCLCVTDVLLTQWDGTMAPLDWFVPPAMEHLSKCQPYQQDPLHPKPPDQLMNAQGEQGIRMELMKRVALDPVYRVTDDNGAWVCPFSRRPIPSINLITTPFGPAMQNAIVDYLLSEECPGKYSQWKPDIAVADLQRIVGRMGAERVAAASKAVAEDELNRLRTRVTELGKRVAGAEELEKDLDAARKVQLKMLPASPPSIEGYELAALYQPCIQLGGDLYNFVQVAPGRTGFVIGDVSGHGVSAAVIMAMAQKSFSVRAVGKDSAARVLSEVNEDLARDMQRGRFVTASYMILDHATGALCCSRAGHTPGLILQPDGSLIELTGNGLALGIGSQEVFNQKLQEYEAFLPSGALLLLYTDGIPEAMNQDKEEFTDERLRETLQTCAGLAPNDAIMCVLLAVREHIGKHPLEDDVTMVAIRRD